MLSAFEELLFPIVERGGHLLDPLVRSNCAIQAKWDQSRLVQRVVKYNHQHPRCKLHSQIGVRKKIKTGQLGKGFLGVALLSVLLSACSSSGSTSSKAESICTTLNTAIAKAEEGASLVSLNRTLGGSDDQIRPSPFDIGDLPFNLQEAGVTFQVLNVDEAVEKFLEVAGSCLSEDAYQYYSNYLN